MQQMRPLFPTEEGITQWMEKKMTLLIKKHIAAEEKRKSQKAYVRESQTYKVARAICTEEEFQELLNEGFLDNPHPQFGPFTDEEIMQEIAEGEKEGYLSSEESMAWLNRLAAV